MIISTIIERTMPNAKRAFIVLILTMFGLKSGFTQALNGPDSKLHGIEKKIFADDTLKAVLDSTQAQRELIVSPDSLHKELQKALAGQAVLKTNDVDSLANVLQHRTLPDTDSLLSPSVLKQKEHLKISLLDSLSIRTGYDLPGNDSLLAEKLKLNELNPFNQRLLKKSPLNTSESSLPDAENLNGIIGNSSPGSMDVPDITELPVDTDNIPETITPDISDKLSDASSLNQPLSISLDTAQLKNEISSVGDLQTNSEVLEKKVNDIEPVKDVAENVEAVESVTEQLTHVNVDTVDLKTGVKNVVKKHVDPFEGKEEILKKDMEEIGKLQIKYRDVPDSRFLPKRPPNPWKNKTFAERLIPGISLQIFYVDNVSIDVNPFVGYHINGYLSAGLGGYRRITYFRQEDALRINDLYGIRSFAIIKIYKGFSAYVESEICKSFRSGYLMSAPVDKGWSGKLNVGIHQRYRFTKHLSGHTILMYDVLKIKQFPSSTNSALRFGFEYKIVKRKKDKK
jgi:hypothetical protein